MATTKIADYRNAWMAVAIIWVIIYHSFSIEPNSLISFLISVGYGGVDIFIFASGMGCWYSLDTDDNCYNFMKKRISRIIPIYWTFLPFWFLYKYLSHFLTKASVIGNIFCVEEYTIAPISFNWYMSAIWIYYFMAPYLYNLSIKNKGIIKIGVFFSLLAITIAFWDTNKLIVSIARLPIFFVGMLAGQYLRTHKKIKYFSVIISFILMVVGFASLYIFKVNYSAICWSKALYWYPFLLITPGLCILISTLCAILQVQKFTNYIVKVLLFIGQYTFELYLTHIFVFEVRDYALPDIKNENVAFVWMVSIIVTILLAFLLNKFAKIMMNCFEILIKWV